MLFETAGITAPPWLPPLAGFLLAFVCSMVGVSGAFLLLPFQMSVLGYVAPSVSATNLVFNLVAIPSGVWRYAREARLDWRLARVIALGTLPGLLVGWWLRVYWLADPRSFRLFVALVLLALAIRLVLPTRAAGGAAPAGGFPARAVFWLSLAIGVIGGAYGIGGGALMSPVLVGVLGLSIHAVAGATLFGTLLTSVVGVALYQLLPAPQGVTTQPDWLLGLLFGSGGAAGMYLGARTQRHIPQGLLKRMLALLMVVLAGTYLAQYLR